MSTIAPPAPIAIPSCAPAVIGADGALALLLRVGGPALVREMAALYRSYAPARLSDARAALAGRDAPALRAACHALRSGAAQLGLSALAAACRSVELAGASATPSWPALHDGVRAIHSAYQPALDWLDHGLQTREAS